MTTNLGYVFCPKLMSMLAQGSVMRTEFSFLLTYVAIIVPGIAFAQLIGGQYVSPDEGPEERAWYQLSCYPEIHDPKVFWGVNDDNEIEDIEVDRAFSFVPHSIVKVARKQFLLGTLVTSKGRQVFYNAANGTKVSDLLILSEQWYCQLYRGGKEWPQMDRTNLK